MSFEVYSIFFLNKPMFYFSGVSFSEDLQCFSDATPKLGFFVKIGPKRGSYVLLKCSRRNNFGI